MFWKDDLVKDCTGIWSFLYHQVRWYLFFTKTWSDSSDGKKVDILCQCSGKMVFVFCFCNMILPFCQKSRDYPLLKHTLKEDISGIIEKDMMFILEDMVCLLTGKWR